MSVLGRCQSLGKCPYWINVHFGQVPWAGTLLGQVPFLDRCLSWTGVCHGLVSALGMSLSKASLPNRHITVMGRSP